MSNELKSNQRGFVGSSSSRANGEIGGYKESKKHITVEFDVKQETKVDPQSMYEE